MSSWTQSERRVQVHELGHAVVDFVTSGVASDTAVAPLDGEFVGVSQPISSGKTFHEMDREERLAVVAGL